MQEQTPNETPQQPTPAATAPSQPVAPATPYVENPGQTLGIIGIITNVMGVGIAGIILGVMSRNKSREAGHPTTLGTVSLVWGIVITVLTVLGFIFGFLLIILAASTTSDINERAEASRIEAESKTVPAENQDELFSN